ncbi:DNA repair helicase XPB [Evansella halocellulosilytica]|uniref:DNA repair helicase XPB n=1 Tax=Evansella halocellulosilytica TaxID=2011013 RepID=UPI0015CE66CD|nr:DNA repair helicase XPB [Evansella halocellulosilytica]
MKQQPLYLQEDGLIYFNSVHPEANIAHPFISKFAHLKQSPSEMHIYELSQYSVWYAFDQGITSEEIITFLISFSNPPVPSSLMNKIRGWEDSSRKFIMKNIEGEGPCLFCESIQMIEECFPERSDGIFRHEQGAAMRMSMTERGTLKHRLIKGGYPVLDYLLIDEGEHLPITLNNHVRLRPYQKEAVEAFIKPKSYEKGNGFIILPCGSGKTLVGIGVMSKINEETLIIAPNDTSLHQWRAEIFANTNLGNSDIGLYASSEKNVRPVTLTTYQMLTYRGESKNNLYPHFRLFQERNWGLIIYDEVHLLPAPLFRMTSYMQGKRRLGLTATFVREDGREDDIYSLIGPKRYELGIKELEHNDWIAKPICKEYKVHFSEDHWEKYLQSSKKEKYKMASVNDEKLNVLNVLVEKHREDHILIIGQYIEQLEKIAAHFSIPIITGKTKKSERENIYKQFRAGKIKALVVSKVANMAVNLPSANVAIQVSGVYGSRQEEAQRIGRLLRPSSERKPVYFYSLVTAMTQEEERASNRQLFMKEQGYHYEWEEWSLCSYSQY